MSNKKLGNSFESELCEILSMYGFWCHNLAQNSAGQPADVIAVRNGKAYLIDCKVCSTDKSLSIGTRYLRIVSMSSMCSSASMP